MTKALNTQAHNTRETEFNVHNIFPGRWSPRAMTGESISEEELSSLFEAARWAPSAYNAQPWTFLYAKQGTPEWDTFFALLVEFNQNWTKNASHLLVIVSKQIDEKNRPQPTASFDVGAAWENLALQAAEMGLVAHGMSGFDYEKAKKNLNVPDTHKVEAMVALGKLAEKKTLVKEMAEVEMPSQRKSVKEISREGSFS